MEYEILNEIFSSFRWTLLLDGLFAYLLCVYIYLFYIAHKFFRFRFRFLSLIVTSKWRNEISNPSSNWVCLMCIVGMVSCCCRCLMWCRSFFLLLSNRFKKIPWFSIYRFLPRGNRIFVLHAACSNPISTTLWAAFNCAMLFRFVFFSIALAFALIIFYFRFAIVVVRHCVQASGVFFLLSY